VKHRRPYTRGRSSPLTSGAEELLAKLEFVPQSFSAWHIPEPQLVFGGGQKSDDPKTGLLLHGPVGVSRAPRTAIRIGVVGTGDTAQLFKAWVENSRGRVAAGLNAKGQAYHPVVYPDFPGFDLDTPFRCRLEIGRCETIRDAEIDTALFEPNYHLRVSKIVGMVVQRLDVLVGQDPGPDVIVVTLPTVVQQRCGVEGRRGLGTRPILTKAEKVQRHLVRSAAEAGQALLGFFDEPAQNEGDEHTYCWDFHNSLKAAAMRFDLPTQLIWEATLSAVSGREDPATTAWNLYTALYYKAGNTPWELANSMARTCFVGISFYRESHAPDAQFRTSLAQAFSPNGEGIILKGDRAVFDPARDRQYHLSRESCKHLLQRTLASTQGLMGGGPERVVIHKTSRYWPEELEGMKDALSTSPSVRSCDMLAIQDRGIRFMRLGTHPPVRGTIVQLARRNYLIYTQGYIPSYREFPGARIPTPLEVVEHHGDSDGDRVCAEVLALTKLNWNACKYASREPITLAFARQVGRILSEIQPGGVCRDKYRYFM
jgi:hypothetical protein